MSCTLLFSDPEAQQHEKKKKEKDRREKSKRSKKIQERQQMPRLTIKNLEQNGEVVECQLETAKHSAINFKFNREDDQPSDIAENLVNSMKILS